MKKQLLLAFFVIGLAASGTLLFGQTRATGLQPTPSGLLLASRQAVASELNLRSEDLPSRVNLAEGRVWARDQGQIGACASFAVSSSLSLMRRKREEPSPSNRSWHSASWLYNQVMIGNDEGSTFHDNLNLAYHAGVATYLTFPFTQDTRMRPGPHAIREAAGFRISEWRRIQHDDAHTFRMFLAQGYPIKISVRVFESLFNYRGGIYRPTGAPTGTFHAMLVTGYCTPSRTFSVKNSWGDSWGEQGFMRFSFDLLENTDFWVRGAFIMVPAARSASSPVFPANVEATMGTRRDRVVISWQAAPNALYYEVFRLDSMSAQNPREAHYVSLGTTRQTTFEDFTARPDNRYFYFVRSHAANISSDLSFPAEGWSSSSFNAPPGPPSGFTAVQQGSTVVLHWDWVEGAERYFVYAWRNSAWIHVGETASTTFIDTNPIREGNTHISYMVTAINAFGESLPSRPASVAFSGGGTDNGCIDWDERFHLRRYTGGFYTFPLDRFRAAERAFLANFHRQERAFMERFLDNQQRFLNNFRRDR